MTKGDKSDPRMVATSEGHVNHLLSLYSELHFRGVNIKKRLLSRSDSREIDGKGAILVHMKGICYPYLQIFSPISTDMQALTDMPYRSIYRH